MKTHEIASVPEFHGLLREHWNGHYLFRGEDGSDYPLKVKFGRQDASAGRLTKRVEMRMFDEFKRHAVPHVTQPPANDWDWLALAQHFGLATRLLDWSENPLVAAYFACRGSGTSDRVLYILNEDEIAEAKLEASPFDIDSVVLFRPSYAASRIAWQRGLFTAHHDPGQQFASPALERCVIRKSCILDLYLTLRTYGVTEEFVFPDLGGLARYLNEAWGVD